MKIVVAGGSGFLGQPLVERLVSRGETMVLSRHPESVRHGRGVAWNPPALGAWADEVSAADVVINLAGENVGEGRWTESRKKRLVASRLDATHALVEAMKRDSSRRRTLINASAVGYYGARGDETLDEAAPPGSGFLAGLTVKWETAAREAESFARVVILRFGVVLDKSGGALEKMLPAFRFGIGGTLGSGEQWMSWIDRHDALRIIEWAVDRADARGTYNATAPQPVRNREFTEKLAAALHRPAIVPVPAFALRLAFGQMADEMLLTGQRVVPARATAEGFTFVRPTLDEALIF